jgi:hypothetical protein
MGADNQAERVIARIEFHEHLARLFHAELCKNVKLLKIDWDDLSEEHRSAILQGMAVVLDEITRRETEQLLKE